MRVTHTRVGRFDYKWVALAVVLTGTIMTILDATIVNIAIPTLQHDLHAGSYTDIAWVVTGYLLAQGAVIPLTGWATDRWGTKRLYLITIVTVHGGVDALRYLAEPAGAHLLPGPPGHRRRHADADRHDHHPAGRRARRTWAGSWGSSACPMLIAPAVGPVLGGWFVQDFTWRLIFYVNVPIGILGFLAASRFLRESHRTAKLRLDVARACHRGAGGARAHVRGRPQHRAGLGLAAGGVAAGGQRAS